MKLLGSVLIILASIASSYFYEQKLKKRIKSTKELCDLINHIKNKIEYFSLTINDILESYQTDSDFIRDLINSKELCDLSLLENTVTNDVRGFIIRLGKGFKKEQLALCDYTLNVLEASKDKMKMEFSKKAKVFRSLSLFFGIGVVILLV